jgi:Flp pilus assembly protein TadB
MAAAPAATKIPGRLANRTGALVPTLHPEQAPNAPEIAMLLTLAIVLFVVWALCVLVFHVAFALVHLLIILGVIALVMHFVRGARRTTV